MASRPETLPQALPEGRQAPRRPNPAARAFLWLDRRYRLREPLEYQLNKKIPGHLNWTNCFGGITFVCFMLQALTGILLAFYYKPTLEEAYPSVLRIMEEVPFGAFVRGLHAWTANVMIFMAILHMLKVFFISAYRPPREFTWVSGVLLFFTTVTFGFSGYLLPMNQLAFWATTVGTEIAGAMPLVGGVAEVFLLGGGKITGETLTRFYAIHVLVLPAAILLLLAAHFSMIRRQGISEPL
jgi:quinol-cytochrome oxidoreductase complex cytochrome b subunit